MFIFGLKAATPQSAFILGFLETGLTQGQFSNGLQPRGTDYSVYQSLGLNVNTQFLEFNVTAVNYDSQPMFSNWGITNPSDQPSLTLHSSFRNRSRKPN